MSKELIANEKSSVKQPKPEDKGLDKQHPVGPSQGEVATVLNLQRQVGNQAVQRLLAQRSGGEEGFDLDDETTNRINQARGSGQALDGAVQKQMGSTMGHDFSGVKVHTSAESDTLNRQLNAKAFTTGQDVFFKQGEYNPGSSSGQELIAHELTHVVQQSSGQVSSSGGGMSVRPAGDAFEQEADAMARQAVSGDVQMKSEQAIQRAAPEEEEMALKRDDAVQRQEEEEEMMQMKADDAVQRQEEEELALKRDDAVQRQEEEEEMMQMKADDAVQRQEEEELELKRDDAVQRQEEEEEIMPKRDDSVQRQESDELENV